MGFVPAQRRALIALLAACVILWIYPVHVAHQGVMESSLLMEKLRDGVLNETLGVSSH